MYIYIYRYICVCIPMYLQRCSRICLNRGAEGAGGLGIGFGAKRQQLPAEAEGGAAGPLVPTRAVLPRVLLLLYGINAHLRSP